MADHWSSSLDLFVPLDGAGGRRDAIERALREAVRDGRLAAGRSLPSSRSLARDLGVARGTIMAAYEQLAAEGYLVARPGASTRVAGHAPVPPALTPKPEQRSTPRFDFFPGAPDLSAFPRSQWLAAMRAVLREAPDAALGYGDPRGVRELREELAVYLGRARGVAASPENIVVCSGFSEGLALVCHALRGLGADSIALEDPCLPHFRGIVGASGLRLVAAPVDELGASAEGLGDTRAVVVTPAHHAPLGVTMHPERRAALLAWATERDAYVIEDDYDGEFRYDRQPVGSLQGLDPARVIYGGTVSKTLAPGLRLGWLVVPSALLDAVTTARQSMAASPGTLEQLALARLLASGQFDRHVRRMRSRYRLRRDRLVVAINEAAPGVTVSGVAAGLHLLLTLPEHGPSAGELTAEARARGIRIWTTAYYRHEPARHTEAIVAGYGALPEHDVTAAFAALVGLLADSYGQRALTAPGVERAAQPVPSIA